MRGKRFLGLACAGGIGLLASSGAARALTDEEIFREFRFNFINPGARALALGGAFVAIDGDVTTAEANPAGLFSLSAPQVFVEYRAIQDDTRVFSGESGSLAVDPGTGERNLPFFGVTSNSEPETVQEPSFLGFVWPLKLGPTGRRLALIASRHVVLSQENSLSSGTGGTSSRFAFESFPNTVNGSTVEAYSVATPITGTSDMDIVYWSVGSALEVHRDFSFGYTLSYAALDVKAETVTQVVDPLELFVSPAHPRLAALPTSDVFRTRIDDGDAGLAYSVGIHWHPDSVFSGGSSRWRLGAVFRKGADFEASEATFLNGVRLDAFVNKVTVPDRYSLGVSYRVDPRWLLVGEYERIEYSDMLAGFRSGVNYLTSGQVAEQAFDLDPGRTVAFTVDDGKLPRVGVEYQWPDRPGRALEIAARAGYYRRPDSRIRMSSFNSDDADVNRAYLEAFGGGDAEDHFTAGVGVTRGRSRFEIAADFADEGTQVVGSYGFTLSQFGQPSGTSPTGP